MLLPTKSSVVLPVNTPKHLLVTPASHMALLQSLLAAQVWPGVHCAPVFVQTPVPALHESAVQALLSLHLAAPPPHVPAVQVMLT